MVFCCRADDGMTLNSSWIALCTLNVFFCTNKFETVSLVENQNDLELDFKGFLFADSCCLDIVIDESN